MNPKPRWIPTRNPWLHLPPKPREGLKPIFYICHRQYVDMPVYCYRTGNDWPACQYHTVETCMQICFNSKLEVVVVFGTQRHTHTHTHTCASTCNCVPIRQGLHCLGIVNCWGIQQLFLTQAFEKAVFSTANNVFLRVFIWGWGSSLFFCLCFLWHCFCLLLYAIWCVGLPSCTCLQLALCFMELLL